MAVGGTGVAVGGTGVAVGGTGVAVGGTGVDVGGTGVSVGIGVAVGGRGVDVGGAGVAVGIGVGVVVGGTFWNTRDRLCVLPGSNTPCAGGVEGTPFRKNSTGKPITLSSVGAITRPMKLPLPSARMAAGAV